MYYENRGVSGVLCLSGVLCVSGVHVYDIRYIPSAGSCCLA